MVTVLGIVIACLWLHVRIARGINRDGTSRWKGPADRLAEFELWVKGRVQRSESVVVVGWVGTDVVGSVTLCLVFRQDTRRTEKLVMLFHGKKSEFLATQCLAQTNIVAKLAALAGHLTLGAIFVTTVFLNLIVKVTLRRGKGGAKDAQARDGNEGGLDDVHGKSG